MKPTTTVPVGDAISASLIDSIKRWRQAYAPSEPTEGLVGGPIRLLKVQTTIRKPAHYEVHVHVEGKKHGTSDDYWYDASCVAGELRLESWTD